MHCQACHQNPATVRVIELTHTSPTQASAEPASAGPASAGPVSQAPATHQPGVGDPLTAPQSSEKVLDAQAAGDPALAPHAAPKEQWLCEACAQAKHELFSQAKDLAEVWKLLKAQQPAARKQPPSVACPDCGMTLRDFRQRGRLGCPRDYEIFGAQLHDLLERLHGSARHVGRGPRQDESAVLRRRRLDELQQELASAIRDEAYEHAARLRDEIKSLERS